MNALSTRQPEADTLYERVGELPLEIEGYTLASLSQPIVPEYTRRTTVVYLRGGGEEGIGEDVTPPENEQLAFQRSDTRLPLAGRWRLGSFSLELERLLPAALSGGLPGTFRRWAFESAAIDLALRQAGLSLPEALGRAPRPVRFVNSLRLSPTCRPDEVEKRLQLNPALRFKLDPTPDWDDDFVARLAATEAVVTLDLKGQYPPQAPVALPPDPVLYRRIAEAFPQAWLEDPGIRPDTITLLEPHRDRITWDAPVRRAADIEQLPIPPAALNVKPGRVGTLRRLFELYAYCDAAGVPMYGGGMLELGPGRGQAQYLASLFHPEGPNDVAPVTYNQAQLVAGAPRSPLHPKIAPTGFQWVA